MLSCGHLVQFISPILPSLFCACETDSPEVEKFIRCTCTSCPRRRVRVQGTRMSRTRRKSVG